jgi:pimeloyl-ACP methyl ester carboxylesterase
MFRLKRVPLKSGTLRIPVLIIWGMKDMALEHQLAELSLKKCENGKLNYFPDATHWVLHEKRKEIKKLISDFISQ